MDVRPTPHQALYNTYSLADMMSWALRAMGSGTRLRATGGDIRCEFEQGVEPIGRGVRLASTLQGDPAPFFQHDPQPLGIVAAPGDCP